jgi:cell division protein FtsW
MMRGLGASSVAASTAALRDRLFGALTPGARRPGLELNRGRAQAGPVARPAPGTDRLLGGVILLLVATGVVMVFSAGAAFAGRTYGDFAYFLKREAIYATAGLIVFALALRTDYGFYRRLTYPLLFLTIGLLVAVLVVGTRVNGSMRWFRVGPLSFQPSELAKVALVLYLAGLLARKAGEQVRTFATGFLPPLIVTGALAGLVVIEPDLGSAAVMGVAALAMMFVAGTRTAYLLAAVLLVAPVVWQKLILGESWRLNRLIAFLDPWSYCSKAGFQLCESLISLGSGGPLGVGLGESRQKLFFLPEAHTDFILAVLGEELGLVGVSAVATAFVLLVWRGCRAALRARDAFGTYLAFGITALFGVQAFFNMAVVMGLLPTKGLALPFVSYGGTSLVVSLFMAGILCNISAGRPEPRRETLSKRARAANRNRKARALPRIIVEVGGPRRAPIPFASPAIDSGPVITVDSAPLHKPVEAVDVADVGVRDADDAARSVAPAPDARLQDGPTERDPASSPEPS